MFRKILDLITDFKLTRQLLAMRYHGYFVEIGWFNSFRAHLPLDENNQPLPWLTYSFIEFIKKYLRPDMSLLEFGSGNSSLFYSKYIREVVAVEHNKEWYDSMSAQAPHNCTIIYKELEYGQDYSKTATSLDKIFDVIVVDGRDRANCIIHSEQYVAENGILVLDDAERPEYSDARNFLQERGYNCIEFWGIAPHYFHSKCTAVYFKGNMF